MSANDTLIQVVASYIAATLIVTLIILCMGYFPEDIISLDWTEILLVLQLSAIFALPVFVVAGLPYMEFGYRSWGRNHQVFFILIGGLLGAVGAAAFGALFTMPHAFPTVLVLIGLAAGIAASLTWSLVARRLEGKNA